MGQNGEIWAQFRPNPLDCGYVEVAGMAGEGSGPASVSVQMGQGAGGQLAGLLAALVHHDNVL